MPPRLRIAAAGAAVLIAGTALLLASGARSPRERAQELSFEAPQPGAELPSLGELEFPGVGVVNVSGLGKARPPMQTIVQDDALFLHRDDQQVRAAMERAKALGVDWVRLTAGWSVIAPEPDRRERPDFDATDPNAYPRPNWRNLDRAVREAKAAGLEVMIDIAFWAPLWATRDDPGEGRARWNIDPAQYADFVKAVVTRYNGEGGFVPEPDTGAPPPPSQDASLLESAYGEDSAGSESSDDETDLLGLLGPRRGGHGAKHRRDAGAASARNDSAEPPVKAEAPLPRVSRWTIWNEPNHTGFVQPQWRVGSSGLEPSSPYAYRALVDAAYPAIKGLQPDSTVLVGGTSSIGNERPRAVTDGMPPLRFLRALACVDRNFKPIARGPCQGYRPLPGDGWSHHPYSLLRTPDYSDRAHPDSLRIGDLRRLTAALDRLVAMRRIDPKLRNLYLTEFGYETNPPDPVKPFNPEEQARLINWAEYLAWLHPQVRSFPQFLLQDLGTASAADRARGKREYGDWQSGLYFLDGSPKPAAKSFQYALHVDCVTASAARGRRARGARGSRRLDVIWGRVRPGSGPLKVRLQKAKRANGAFRAAATAARVRRRVIRATSVAPVATDAGGSFLRFAPHERAARYRFEYTAPGGDVQQSLAVAPDVCSGTSRQKKLRGPGADEF